MGVCDKSAALGFWERAKGGCFYQQLRDVGWEDVGDV